jgi:anthranilate/para-aminobenzoate synthase component I
MTTGLLRHPLPFPVDPEHAFARLDDGHSPALWLDDHGDRGSGVTYLAFPTPIEVVDNSGVALAEKLAQHFLPPGASAEGLPLGVFFVMPYEAGYSFVGLTAPEVLPTHALWVDQVVAINHATKEAVLWALGTQWSTGQQQWRDGTEKLLASAQELAAPVVGEISLLSWRDSREEYLGMIEAAHQAIRDGDAYQLCVTTTLSIAGQVDPVALHRRVRKMSPTHHQALIRVGELTIVAASPETFLEVSSGGEVITKPIKGTRPRGETPEDDARLAHELVTSEKERAENLMIVDLMRNDLSKVCEVGSVSVPILCEVESYSTVHQLVSTVVGQLRAGIDLWGILRECFPAGSMTGAPKKRAMEVLNDQESGPRGYYSGIFGMWRVDGSATVAMTIRSAMVYPDHLTLGVGGGITALSEPDAEIREVGIKATAFLQALGVSQDDYS